MPTSLRLPWGLPLLLAVSFAFGAPPEEPTPAAEEHAAHALPETPGESPGAAVPDVAEGERIIRSRTNAFRERHDLAPVERNDELSMAAKDFARWMAEHQKYGHEADGRTPTQRIEAAGYEPCLTAENIAYQYNSEGFDTVELGKTFFVGWRESPPHRRNMLQADATQTGVGIAQNAESGKYFAVQLFGRPKSETVRFKIVNETEGTIVFRSGDRRYELPPRYTMNLAECGARTVTFLPREAAGETAETEAEPVAEIAAKDGQTLTARPTADGYDVVTNAP